MAQPIPEILRTWSEDTPSSSILHVRGEVDLCSAPCFRTDLVQLIGRGRPVVVDFSELQFLDMKGIHVLEDCNRLAEQRGQRLVLVGSVPLVHKILTIAKVKERICVVDTVAEALEVLG